jgi:hypothetical protein
MSCEHLDAADPSPGDLIGVRSSEDYFAIGRIEEYTPPEECSEREIIIASHDATLWEVTDGIARELEDASEFNICLLDGEPVLQRPVAARRGEVILFYDADRVGTITSVATDLLVSPLELLNSGEQMGDRQLEVKWEE